MKAQGCTGNTQLLNQLTRGQANITALHDQTEDIETGLLPKGQKNLDGVGIFHISNYIEIYDRFVTKVKIVSLNQIYKSKITNGEIWMKTTCEESRVSINYLIPNKETIEAIRQAREENLEKFKTIEDLMNDLNSNNQQD